MKDRATLDALRKTFREELPVHERIRNRREARQLTGGELAARAGVSPAYISLIEKGLRIPEEKVAVDIARALRDDLGLYLHWVRAGRHPTTREARDHYEPLSANARLRRSLAAGDDLPMHRINLLRPSPVAGRRRSEDERVSSAVAIPVLPWCTEPGRPGSEMPRRSAVLWLDTRLLPDSGRNELFAYPVADTVPAASVASGDQLVMTRRVRRIATDHVYAVRLGPRIVMSHVAFRKTLLLVLPSEGGNAFEVIPVDSMQAALERLAAVVVLALRRWP